MRIRHAVLICVPFLIAPTALAELGVPSIFSDHMVLQQGQEVPIWGWAHPREQVQVMLKGADGASQRVRAGADGRWMVRLGSMSASATPRDLVIRTMPESANVEREQVVIHDVLVGEVWVCSGQSNMQWTLAWSDQADIDMSTADHDQLRMFTATRASLPEPQDDLTGSWVPCNKETAPELSAIAYYFGRELQRELDVPIGLIHTSWGGSTAEAWTTRPRLQAMEETRPILERFEGVDRDDPDTDAFSSITFDDTQWRTANLPSMFADQGHDIDGSIWYRRHLDLPTSWAGRDLQVSLGPIDDADRTWFNGLPIGETENWQAQRNYVVPASVVKAGSAILTIRVTDFQGPGGFKGTADQMHVGPVDDSGDRRSLAGPWLMKVSERPLARPMPENHRPAHLYNAMIHPIVPYGIQGAIWYQGESNVNRAEQYSTLFPAMIEDWRSAWGEGDFAFFFVQIAPFDYGRPLECAELREAQGDALDLPATGMVVTMDVGNPKDIHPRAKEPVGHRLALLARKDVYGHDVEARAPMVLEAETTRNQTGAVMALKFHGGCMPLKTFDGGAPTHFEIAGEDRVFHPAQATIEGDRVLLTSDQVAAPVAARFGWDDDAEPNLIGACGLPVGPFRTDSWPRVTKGRW